MCLNTSIDFSEMWRFPDLPVFACPPAARTRDVMKEFGDVYEQQYAVALFNSVRFEIEGGGATQSQLLHRKASWSYRQNDTGHTQTVLFPPVTGVYWNLCHCLTHNNIFWHMFNST